LGNRQRLLRLGVLLGFAPCIRALRPLARAGKRLVESALEDSLRAFAKAFPFFLQLLKEPESGTALSEGFAKLAGERGDPLLRGGDGFGRLRFFGAGFGNAGVEFGDALGA